MTKLSRFGLFGVLSLLAATATATATVAQPASGEAAPAMGESSPTLAAFAVAHDLVDIGGGRRINLYCIGSGPRTVLFDAGGSDWSAIWGLVQPAVAARARACSYDRAGLGYSDAAVLPRSPSAIVDDVHALVRAAKLATPLVLVGHSLGGFNMKLYAALHPEDVAGLVLVDPAEDRWAARTRAATVRRFGAALAAQSELGDMDTIQFLTARYAQCVDFARAGDLDPQSLTYRRCTDPVRPKLGPAVAAERARLQVKAKYQEAQASELAHSVYAAGRNDALYDVLFSGHPFGNRPTVVLTHGRYDATDPIDAIGFEEGSLLHAQTAALSTRGRHRVVPDTSHNIEIDDPNAIVQAVFEVIDQLAVPTPSSRRGRPRRTR